MAAPNQQFAYSSTHRAAYLRQHIVPGRAMVSVNCEVISNASMRSGGENSILYNPSISKIHTRNTIIALFILLVLLLPMQAPAADKTLQPAQVPSSEANNPVTYPVTARTQAESISKKMAVPAALELAAATPGPAPEQSATTTNEDLKTHAATTLTAVTAVGFVKIASSGQPLGAKADRWECVEDKSSKLTWEVKKNDSGIRDKDYTYTWLRGIIGENKGVSNGGRCKGDVKCDTYSYVRAMNEQKLCGYSDWRLPTREEMETLIDYNTTAKDATINKTYFPEAVPSWYWTATENSQRENFAWYVLFRNGIALNDLKERPKHIRLVRGIQTQ